MSAPPRDRPPHRLAEVGLWLVPAVWSSNYLIARAAGPWVPPHLLAFGRWGLVFVVLLALCGRGLWARRACIRREAWQLLVLGALGMWICGAWVYQGGQSTSATNIGLIYACAPIGIAIAGHRLLGERASSPAQIVAMAAAVAGVLLIVLRGDPRVLVQLQLSAGDLWIVAATLAWVAYSVLLQAWKTGLRPLERLCASAGAGLLVMLPFAAWEWQALQAPLAPRAWQLIALAGLLPGLLAYGAYSFMLRELGVGRAALVLYLAPLYGALLAWALLGEVPQWFHVAGAAMILPGIYLARSR